MKVSHCSSYLLWEGKNDPQEEFLLYRKSGDLQIFELSEECSDNYFVRTKPGMPIMETDWHTWFCVLQEVLLCIIKWRRRSYEAVY